MHHRFIKPALLSRALLHASAATRGDRGNERLEFLGDRVLGLLLAEVLMERHPDEPEGELAKRHAYLASRPVLAEVALRLDLGPELTLARGERDQGGAVNPAILADAMEAVLAAVYLDAGLDAARRLVLREWHTRLDVDTRAPQDPKTALQEWTLGRGLGLPTYATQRSDGPAHDPMFEVTVTIAGGRSALGSGRSKREAEKAAAAALMVLLREGVR